jgi:hypothetical protein
MPICVYCHTEARRFPAEHVIPVSFGRFRKNLTLRSVCGDCNQYFSKELEVHFTRDSPEGIARFNHGLRGSSAGRNKTDRFSAICTEDAAFGARLALVPAADRRNVKYDFPPQVGFFCEGSTPCHWLTEDELTAEKLREISGYTHTKFLVRNAEEEQRLRERLEHLGCGFGPVIEESAAEPGALKKARITATFDSTTRRCIAKIAFNYFVWAVGATEFPLRADFDELRRYIRWGLEDSTQEPPFVRQTNETLVDPSEPGQGRLDNGHIVAITWNQSLTGLVAHVTLFRKHNYKVLLCPKYSGVWFDFKRAHHFDLRTREAHELGCSYITLK